MERYFTDPYRFIPPYRSTFWVRMSHGLIRRNLRKKHGIVHYHYRGLEHFHDSLAQKAGILLAPNHCRSADPPVVGIMAYHVKQYPYYVASYHLFRQSKFTCWMLNRLGGYSIHREGADRESLRTTSQLLSEGERPVVLFPEGTWFRQNDQIAPLQDGLSLITRQAARQTTRPILVHPVGVKYWYLDDVSKAIGERLTALERRIGWHAHGDSGPVERLEKLGGALLALKEIEYLGQASAGDLDKRIRDFIAAQVEALERRNLGRSFDGWILERIRRLRQHLIRLLNEHSASAPTVATAGATRRKGKRPESDAVRKVKKDLDELLLCENLNAQSLHYVKEWPSQERIAETIQRIEETLTDADEVPLGRIGADIRIGRAIDVRSLQAEPATGGERKSDPLVTRLRKEMQELMDQQLAEGPPPEWGCPAREPYQPRSSAQAGVLAAASPIPPTSPTHVDGQLIS